MGLVIAKQGVHSFPDRKSKIYFKHHKLNYFVFKLTLTISLFNIFADPGSEKFHFFFTLRDSPTDFINVNCWGSENFIKNLATSFKINDVGTRKT